MEKHEGDLQTLSYARMFPWIHLFRAFRIAVDYRKIVLASVGLVCLIVGNRAFLTLPFAPTDESGRRLVEWPWDESLFVGDPLTIPAEFLNDPSTALRSTAAIWGVVLRPLESVIEPARLLFSTDSIWSPELAFAWTKLLWAVAVWSVFGGAITRMAAVQFARDEKIGMRAALRYSIGKFLSYFSAPLLPLGGVGALWLLCLLGGLIGRIPVFGDVVVGAFFFVALLLGFVMALVLMGVAVGWPLMFVTVSAEGSDGFDGFSRSYSYVYSRPWHYLWYSIVAMIYGSIVILFVLFVASLVVYLAGWGVAAGMGAGVANEMLQGAPRLLNGGDMWRFDREPLGGASSGIGPIFTGVWLHFLTIAVFGFIYSYFWSAVTIIYFLLRQSDDATDLDEVYLPEEEEEDELLPLVGVARSDQPVVERPPDTTMVLDAEGGGHVYSGDTELDIHPEGMPPTPKDR